MDYFLIFFYFFQPTNGRFCRLELSNTQCRLLARTACYLFDFLVEAASFEADKILDDFLKDFQDCIISLIHSDSAHDCLLSPTRVASSGCQYYFLFIGRLSKSARGREALDQRSILGHFTELLGTVTPNQEYHSEIQKILGFQNQF